VLISNPVTSMNAKSADQQLNKFNNDFFQTSFEEFIVDFFKLPT